MDGLLAVLNDVSHYGVPFSKKARRSVFKLQGGLGNPPSLGLLPDEVFAGHPHAVQGDHALAPLNNQVQVVDGDARQIGRHEECPHVLVPGRVRVGHSQRPQPVGLEGVTDEDLLPGDDEVVSVPNGLRLE